MAKGVLMPKTGITVEECVLTEWIKKKGDSVKIGDILFTYETDKSTFECESTEEGILLETFYEEGDVVPVLVNVCAIGQEGDEVDSLRTVRTVSQTDDKPNVPETKAEEDKPQEYVRPEEIRTVGETEDHIKISPRARMAAERFNVDPALAVPTGAEGRIIERDVRAYVQSRPGDGFGGRDNNPRRGNRAPSGGGERAYVDVPFTPMRKAVAKNMKMSLDTMAQLTHFHSFDATEILNLHKKLKANGEKMGLPPITVNDLILYGVSRVLPDHEDLNAVMPEENLLRRYTDVHLGMAVDTPKGLLVPTIFDANKKSLTEIALETKELTQICRDGKASPDMLSGGTFTVSNLGSFGCEMFTPIINPPQTGILGVCCPVTRVRETEHGIETYPAMGLALTYDHRAVDGVYASSFLKDLCTTLENFELLMID